MTRRAFRIGERSRWHLARMAASSREGDALGGHGDGVGRVADDDHPAAVVL